MNRSDWAFDSSGRSGRLLDQGPIRKAISQIAALARDEEARKLLGVEGVLEGQLDLAFLNDPLEWLASDIANALASIEDGSDDTASGESLSLDIIVAEYRLCQLMLGSVDEGDLVRRVTNLWK